MHRAREARRGARVFAHSSHWTARAVQDFVAAFTTMWTTQTYKETEWTRARRVGTWPSEGGGCLNMDSWVTNPQLFLDVPPGAANASVVIVLTQADEKLSFCAGVDVDHQGGVWSHRRGLVTSR